MRGGEIITYLTAFHGGLLTEFRSHRDATFFIYPEKDQKNAVSALYSHVNHTRGNREPHKQCGSSTIRGHQPRYAGYAGHGIRRNDRSGMHRELFPMPSYMS